MAVQVRQNNATNPFVLHGVAASKNDATIQQDAGRGAALERYTVMAQALIAAGTVTADVGNTGDGTVTALALAPGSTALVGTYNFTCMFAVTNGGVFQLEDPNGNIVAENITLRVGAGLLTSVVAGGLSFVVTDGATDFIATDTFAITVTAVNKWLPLDLTAVNGLQIPKGIYVGDQITAAAIVAGDVPDAPIITGGCVFVDENQVILESSATLDDILPSGETIREALNKIGIITEDTIDISGYENV